MQRSALTRALAAVLLIALAVGCQHTQPSATPASPKETGWRAIYDGTNKDGWIMTGPGEFKQVEGALMTEGGMGLLWYSREKLANCQIRVVYKLATSNSNSGVFIRIPNPPADPWQAVHQGYEVQIDDNDDLYHRTGCLYSLTKARHIVKSSTNEWNTMLITLDGPRTMVEVNGELVTDYREGDPVPEKKEWYEPDRRLRPLSGYFGLQNHDGPGAVYFKEVSVRPLQRKENL